jgi:hypothetical protein
MRASSPSPTSPARDRAVLVLFAIGCSRGVLSPPGAPDAGIGAAAEVGASIDVAEAGMTAADASAPAEAGAPFSGLKVAPAPTQAAATFDPGDENPGASPDGWDLCPAGQLVSAPREGRTDPPGPHGTRYLIYDPQAPKDPAPGYEAQLYFYFGAPPAGVRGLWLDLTKVDGDPADAALVLYAVDEICGAPRMLARHALAPVLRAGAWVTACAPLAEGEVTQALGLRFEGRAAEIGVDAVRFGPPCPP